MPWCQTAIPPPLRAAGAYGMNQTVINDVFPKLLPLIVKDSGGHAQGPIDIYGAMGGDPNWRKDFPPSCAKVRRGSFYRSTSL